MEVLLGLSELLGYCPLPLPFAPLLLLSCLPSPPLLFCVFPSICSSAMMDLGTAGLMQEIQLILGEYPSRFPYHGWLYQCLGNCVCPVEIRSLWHSQPAQVCI